MRSNNNKCSGGFPHSEICGSKPILGSPQLIAEYHVLHRLLLPRHPPNALLALDLIQRKQGFPRSKAYTRPDLVRVRTRLVYLTWTTLFVSAGIHTEKRGSTRLHAFRRSGTELRSTPYSVRSNSVDICISLNDVKLADFLRKSDQRPIGRQNSAGCFTVKSVWMVEPTGIEPVTF